MAHQYATPEELKRKAEDYFCAVGGWVRESTDGFTLSERIAALSGALGADKRNKAASCVPHGWAVYGGFAGYDEFRELRHNGPEWSEVVCWIDNVLRKCAETELMVSDRKNNRGPEILVGTFWGYSAKQVVDLRDGIQAITTAAMTELVPKIPLDDREPAIERFRKAVRSVAGLK